MKASGEKVRRWREADWDVLLRCLVLIPWVEFSVRWRGPRHWLPTASTPERRRERPSAAAQAESIARWVDAAYRRSPFRPTCLTRSLVLYRLLRARGLPCELQIGVRKEDAQFEAHAWVECVGIAVNDSNDVHQRFTHFDPAALVSRGKAP